MSLQVKNKRIKVIRKSEVRETKSPVVKKTILDVLFNFLAVGGDFV